MIKYSQNEGFLDCVMEPTVIEIRRGRCLSARNRALMASFLSYPPPPPPVTDISRIRMWSALVAAPFVGARRIPVQGWRLGMGRVSCTQTVTKACLHKKRCITVNIVRIRSV